MTKTHLIGKIKISMAVILAMLMGIFMPLLQVYAASVDYTPHTYSVRLVLPSGTDYDTYIPEITVNGEKGFCLDISKTVEISDGYNGQEMTAANRDLLGQITYYGWYLNQTSYNYAVTQAMIWEQVHGGDITHFYQGSGSFYDNVNQIGSYQATKAEIMASVNAFEIRPSFHNETFTVKQGDSITLTDSNGVLQNMHLKSNTANVTVSKNGNEVTFTINADSGSGAVTFQKAQDGFVGVPMVYSMAGAQDVGVLKITDPAQGVVRFKVQAHGALDFTKVNLGGEPMSGALFALTNEAGVAVPLRVNGNAYTVAESGDNTFTVGDNGKVNNQGLPEGSYTIEELIPPVGTLIASPIRVAIKAGETTAASMTNESQPLKTRIIKQGTDGKVLAGAIFRVEGNGVTPFNLTTGADGTATSAALKDGTYTVIEEHPPVGYLLSSPASQQVKPVTDQSSQAQETQTPDSQEGSPKLNGAVKGDRKSPYSIILISSKIGRKLT